MARVQTIENQQAAWWLRLVYRMAGNTISKLTGKADIGDALKLIAHRPRLLFGTLMMEMGQGQSNAVPATLKTLASLRVSTLVGCPY
jgi:hypothetical protein